MLCIDLLSDTLTYARDSRSGCSHLRQPLPQFGRYALVVALRVAMALSLI